MVVPDILYFDNDFCVWFLKKRKILEGEIPKKPRELRDRLHILDYSFKLCLFPGLISCRRWLKVSLAKAPIWAGNVCALGVLRKLSNIVTSIEGRSSLRYQEFVVGKNSYTHTLEWFQTLYTSNWCWTGSVIFPRWKVHKTNFID